MRVHLAILEDAGYIRREKLGRSQFVIYPLRSGHGATLPVGDQIDETAENRRQVPDETAENRRQVARNGGKPPPISPNGGKPPPSGTKRRKTAANDDHVVVLNSYDSLKTKDLKQQQHGNAHAEILTHLSWIDEPTRSELAGLPHMTLKYAKSWQNWYQRGSFPDSMTNPVGVAVGKMRRNEVPYKEKQKRWYNDEEFANIIQH